MASGAEEARAPREEDLLAGVLVPWDWGVHSTVTNILESTGSTQQPRSPASGTIFLSQIAGWKFG